MIIKLNAKKLNNLLWICRNQFWSSSCVNEEVESSLQNRSKYLFLSMSVVYTTGVLFCLGQFLIPLASGSMELPIISSYGRDFIPSPYYEVLYTAQLVHLIFSVVHGVTGHDNLFYVLCENAIAQFILLKNSIATSMKEDNRLVKKFVRHHHLLLR